MLLGLAIGNSFGTLELYLVGFSLGTVFGLMVGTIKGSLVGLYMGLLLGYPLEYKNTEAVLGSLFEYLNVVIIDMSLRNTLESLLDSIWHINWCGPLIGAWKFLLQFNVVPYSLFS